MSGSIGKHCCRAALAAVVISCLAGGPAFAQVCEQDPAAVVQAEVVAVALEDTENYPIAVDFLSTESWLYYVLGTYLLPAWMDMAQTATATAMMQTFIFGTFLDAKQQMEVQRTFQELSARAHKDYQSDIDLCTFGTVIRPLADTMVSADTNTYDMSEFGEMRRIGSANTEASAGTVSDRPSRLNQFRARYCDLADNNNGMNLLCNGQAPANTVNRDLDFAGVFEKGKTLYADLADPNLAHPTDDEQDLWALANNLYGHNALWRMPEHALRNVDTQTRILDLRSIQAQRAVAEASYYTIAGMKTLGTPDLGDGNASAQTTAPFMDVILEQLGVSPTQGENSDLALMLGPRPSYYAQMEVLTKRIYQDARFYTNLYTTPANVERKRVAMQAIALMQDFDTLQSHLRTEMMLSQILELNILKAQKDVQNEINGLVSQAVR